jgi:hypothetical protein
VADPAQTLGDVPPKRSRRRRKIAAIGVVVAGIGAGSVVALKTVSVAVKPPTVVAASHSFVGYISKFAVKSPTATVTKTATATTKATGPEAAAATATKTPPLANSDSNAAPAKKSVMDSIKDGAGQQVGKRSVDGLGIAALYTAHKQFCETDRFPKKCAEVKARIKEAQKLVGIR